MKRSMILAAALLIAGGLRADAKPLPTGTFKFDVAHTQLGFEVTHLVISTVTGKFDKFEGAIVVKSDKDISVAASADAASVDTGNAMRDAHLRGDDAAKAADFFNAKKFPQLTFKSTKVTLDGTKLTVVGDLTIRDVTKSVTFEGKYRGTVKDPWGGERIAASLKSTINRQDFNLKFGAVIEAGPVVSDDVDLVLNVEALKDQPKQ
jgi:polyisoprenoid-binding protein YceI